MALLPAPLRDPRGGGNLSLTLQKSLVLFGICTSAINLIP